jgi:NADH:ubiquinone oxidoreductase subunit F (NADH-binding)/Pyruvate/2-oxoacid:ferredoxin oxidoreductase delta subunit
LLHNVETWANVPIIAGQGSRWYSSIPTGPRKGTKIFSLAGAINKTGLVEVPMSTTLREIVCGIGGGVSNGKELKAVHVGGPSGGFIPANRIDMKIDFESLAEAGASMGSGSIVVMDDGTCMVDMTRYFIRFLADNLCGKCTGCQIGLASIADILDRIAGGHGKEDDAILLERLGKVISEGSLCETGANAENAVLSSTRFFREEYRAHVFDKRCPSGKCKSLITFNIDAEKCSGCAECAGECPEGAIAGREGHPHTIDCRLCVRCGICEEVCERSAIVLS